MRAMKCWKRLTAFLLSFVMVLGLVLTNGITSEAARKETAWTEDGEIEVTVPSVMYKTHVQSFGWQNWKLNGEKLEEGRTIFRYVWKGKTSGSHSDSCRRWLWYWN